MIGPGGGGGGGPFMAAVHGLGPLMAAVNGPPIMTSSIYSATGQDHSSTV